jgi:hypothetical protein
MDINLESQLDTVEELIDRRMAELAIANRRIAELEALLECANHFNTHGAVVSKVGRSWAVSLFVGFSLNTAGQRELYDPEEPHRFTFATRDDAIAAAKRWKEANS